MKQVRSKKCRVCKAEFNPWSSTQIVCSPKCATTHAKQKDDQRARKSKKVELEAFKTRGDWVKEAQTAFNAYIRARDMNKTCISSGKPLSSGGVGGGFDCGHYRSVGSAPNLRFNVFNAHGQSKHDNRYLSGNAVDYRIRLIQRIGLDRVERLESDNAPKNYTIADLKRIKKIFAKRARLYQKRFR